MENVTSHFKFYSFWIKKQIHGFSLFSRGNLDHYCRRTLKSMILEITNQFLKMMQNKIEFSRIHDSKFLCLVQNFRDKFEVPLGNVFDSREL